ncbi:acetyltransferase [Cytophagales bacterium LB-30]|uniref:Acetyltransferase n=1 Tax=Shiella aurantiaca TaxID=3058365 RepID=A0ABT8F8E0_9BACT|nr:acetyltransferase [Shiella aurantiaca]MDN4166640.1 acetyltransferase [Shiella aurantiaca]
MKKIAIYGAGGFGKEVHALIKQLGPAEWDFVGFFDDRDLSSALGKHYLGNQNDLNVYPEALALVVALGWSHMRKKVVQGISNPHIYFPTLVSPNCILGEAEAIQWGKGCLLMAGAVLTTDIRMGDFCVININASIGHDVQMGDFGSVMPGANLSGNVVLKEEVFVGTGATILNGLSLAEGAIVGAGALVNRPVLAKQTVVGVPAKPLKKERK